jgi:hypothetical protein
MNPSGLSQELQEISLRPNRFRLRHALNFLAVTLVAVPVAVAALILWSMQERPPGLANGIQFNVGKLGEPSPSPEWSQRLRERIPVGTPDRDVEELLIDEGFVVDSIGNRAEYQWQSDLSSETLTVEWKVDQDNHVVEIAGEYRAIWW